MKYQIVEGYQTTKPLEVDTISSNYTVYLRKNIHTVPNVDFEGKPTEGTHWQYEEAKLSKADYAAYLAQMESLVTEQFMQAFSDLQADQELQDISRQLDTETIMQAISDVQADIALM